ncbi:hypothetical protein [Caldivirga maquilingensis]|uniref:Uncharacterized protein n=1 Tax=Caldivirga maquilingensis (strain ATCC 700844 / DSM 13496 / JCM 10307 / IC-167) TaxID=397948 RepID=A8MBJ3_CALMQ|nr:hypothetical protein [Caldivirga maquilingensis]ABW02726.1 hypothetical protein Cmaq_1909 [Caldivirga maquilingensis IC-167]
MSELNIKYYDTLLSIFLGFFIAQFALRQFLQPIIPFTPAPANVLNTMGLAGTFSVAALSVIIPFLIYEFKVPIPLKTLYLIVIITALWGGVLLSYIYPSYYLTWPWIILSIILWGLTIMSIILAITSLRAIELTLLAPVILLQLTSLVSYILNLVTEYYLIPVMVPSTALVYPTLLLIIIGALTLTALALIEVKVNKWSITGYVLAIIASASISLPLYQLTVNSFFMQHIMDMVFAMGFGVLAPPASVPLMSIILGLYVFAVLALIINGAFHRRYLYLAALAVTYVSTALTPHVLSIYFASVIASSLAVNHMGRVKLT